MGGNISTVSYPLLVTSSPPRVLTLPHLQVAHGCGPIGGTPNGINKWFQGWWWEVCVREHKVRCFQSAPELRVCAEREDLKWSIRGVSYTQHEIAFPNGAKVQNHSHKSHRALKIIDCYGRTIQTLSQDLECYRAVCTHTEIKLSYMVMKHIILPNTIQLWKQLRNHPCGKSSLIPHLQQMKISKQTNKTPKTTKFPMALGELVLLRRTDWSLRRVIQNQAIRFKKIVLTKTAST